LPRGFRPCFVRRPIGRVARIVHCTRAGARCCQGSRNVCSRGKRKGELRTTRPAPLSFRAIKDLAISHCNGRSEKPGEVVLTRPV
jgi:hypothetical protein